MKESGWFMQKVLVVDDEEDIRKLVRSRLLREGYLVIEASNGKEALIKAKKEKPNLILLDILMPDMYGGEVAEILKNDDSTKGIPIVFLTCLYTKSEEMKDEFYPVGKNIFLAKPFETEELLETVRRIIK